MSTSPTNSSSLHPIFWIAGIAVTLLSVVGIASLTGYLPSRSAAPAEPAAAVATAPIAAPATPPVATAPPPDAVTAPPVPAPAVTHHQAAKHKARSVATAVPPPSGAGVPPDYAAAAPAVPPCGNCGVVANIREVTHEGQASGLGAVGGGVVGGALANNIGQGNGRTLATIAGMVGGGLLGNKIEKSQRQTVSYQVSVRMEDGTSQLLNFETMPAWHVGDPVKVVNGSLVAR